MSHDVFFSYARKDDPEVVSLLRKALEALGLDVFFDIEDLPLGVPFPGRLDAALEGAKVVFACWTPRSLRSFWCRYECDRAAARGTLVPAAPVQIGSVDLDGAYEDVNYAQVHDFYGQARHAGWAQVLTNIAALLDRWAAARPDDPQGAETAQKAARVRAAAEAARGGHAETEMEVYDRAVEAELQRTPWALQGPRVQRAEDLFVEVTVGSARPQRLEEVHAEHPAGRFMLLGDPGAGKTMALKHHGLWCRAARSLTPIFLRAKGLEADIEATLRADEAARPVLRRLMQRILDGQAVLLVDSVDEVDGGDGEKARIRKRLEDLAQDPRLKACPIFAASRSVGYVPVPSFTRLDVQQLSSDAMAALLARWEVPEERIAELVAERAGGGRLKSMTENPLLVTLMAIVLRQGGRGPRQWSRTGLYRSAVRALISVAYKKDVEGSAVYPHGDLALEVLGAHALRAHGTDRRDRFTDTDLTAAAGALVRDVRAADPGGQVEGFLAVLAQRTGLIEARGEGWFGFPHRTFAEYLAATALARLAEAEQEGPELQRVLASTSWDAAAEQAAWQPYLAKLERLTGQAYTTWKVADMPASFKESLASYPEAFEFALRPEHEATTAEVAALTHGVLAADGRKAHAKRLLDGVFARALAPQLAARIGRALDALDGPTAHRVLDAIPGTPHWEQRRAVLVDLPHLLAGPAEVLQFLQERAARVTHGADLYWLHRLGVWLGEGAWGGAPPEVRGRAAAWAAGFWADHRPEARAAALASLVWVELPGGSFRMGSPAGEGLGHERPQHAVEVTGPFAMLDAPVTNAQYERFDPGHAADRESAWGQRPDEHPVYNVTWYEAMAFAQWLDAGAPRRVRLPFEVEWEYAARLAVDGPARPLAEVAWFSENSGGQARPVRQRFPARRPGWLARWFGAAEVEPGALPLYDLLGNVWEWCADVYEGDRYAQRAADRPFRHDPAAAEVEHAAADADPSGARRVLRGGSWDYPASVVRVAYRDGYFPGDRDRLQGLRLVRAPCPPAGTLGRRP